MIPSIDSTEERAFGVVKKLAEIKAAAETYAACQEASSTENSTCIQLAQATFEEISGSTEIWDDELAAKVTDLGNAMLEGRDILIRKLKQIVVEMVSDATNCSEEMLTNIMDKARLGRIEKGVLMGQYPALLVGGKHLRRLHGQELVQLLTEYHEQTLQDSLGLRALLLQDPHGGPTVLMSSTGQTGRTYVGEASLAGIV